MSDFEVVGVIEHIGTDSVSGWVRIPEAWLSKHGLPSVELKRGPDTIAQAKPSIHRVDVTRDGCIGYAFKLNLPPSNQTELLSGLLQVVCVAAGGAYELRPIAHLELAARINRASSPQIEASARLLTAEARSALLGKAHEPNPALPSESQRVAAVITYANNADGWFPYFLAYYTGLFGIKNIFVVTPRPEAFERLGLGAVLSVTGFPFDDGSRANLISSLANGFRSYYRWIVVCDVDEIIIPSPSLRQNLWEYLANCRDKVIYSRGLDVIESPGDAPFDFSKDVVSQRKICIPNSALSKPHVSQEWTTYSGGFHFCSRLPGPASIRGELLALHLKWACASIRAEIQATVAKTTYADRTIGAYCFSSADPEAAHPALAVASKLRISFGAEAWETFERKNLELLTWQPARGIYTGRLVAAPFTMSLPT